MAQGDDKIPTRPQLGELSSATRDGLSVPRAFADGIAVPHDASPFSIGRDELRRILRDDQVKSTFQQRRLAVIARDWSVSPGGDKRIDRQAAEHLSQQLSRIGWDRVTEKMLYAAFYGYGVAELIWKIDAGRVEIDRIAVRDRFRFRFGDDGALKLMTFGAEPKSMPPAKFWTLSVGADTDDNPYGQGLWYELYWPVWFKRQGLKSWLQGLDKTARPTAVGKFPTGASQADIEKLLDVLRAYASDTGIAIPEAMSIELLQAARSGTTDYDTLYRRMDSAISKIVLSQTMTTDSASTGLGSTQGDVHQDVKREIVKADADLLCESFSCSVATWLTAWNFPGAAVPIVARQTDDPEDLNALSERDQRLSGIGYRPNEERVREVYGEGYELQVTASGENAVEEPAASANLAACPNCGSADFAANDPDLVDGIVAAALEDDGWVRQMEPVLAPLARAAGDAADLEAIRDGLIDRLSEMDVSALQETLAQSAFAARIAGRLGADREDAAEIEVPQSDLSEPDDSLLRRLFGLKKKVLI